MKKIVLLALLIITGNVLSNAQIQKGGCNDYKNYNALVKDASGLKKKSFEDDPIKIYGLSPVDVKYKAKIEVLKRLTGNQQYLNNPRVDSILAEFAGEVVFLQKDEYEVFKTRKKEKDLGAYTCFVYNTVYNPDLIEFLTYQINNFIKYSVTFIINPYIEHDGYASTKDLYKNALASFHTLILQPKYGFDNVVEDRMLEKAKLQAKPANYNPAEGFQTYKTGNKYLDYATSITTNANRSRQVDIILSIDTITVNKVPGTEKRNVNFHVIGFNTHTATEILVFDSKIEIEANNDYDAVEAAINTVFARDVDKYIYDMTKRYSSYARNGMLFSIKIADSLVNDNNEMMLEQAMLDCKLFADGSIAPGEWRNNGQQIGRTYEGRTYLLDRLRLKIMIFQLLQNAGFRDFKLDISGTDYIITPK